MPKNALAQVLLDFGRTPGRYALRLREPAELYAQLDTLALWAQGRVPDALQAQAQELGAAAVLFIQRACFAQENNHYQVLGLLPGPVDPDFLRARYRSLIRLTHPDRGVQGLPSGAAGMVNRAQEVLGNPELCEQYDQQLEGSAPLSWKGVAPAPPAPSAADVRGMQRRRIDQNDHGGMGERWRALWARYPTQARMLLTATGVGVLVVTLLAWAAHDAPGGAMLVVARAPAQAGDTSAQSAPRASKPTSAAAATPAPVEPKSAPPLEVALPAAVAVAALDREDNQARLSFARDLPPAAAAPKAPETPPTRGAAPIDIPSAVPSAPPAAAPAPAPAPAPASLPEWVATAAAPAQRTAFYTRAEPVVPPTGRDPAPAAAAKSTWAVPPAPAPTPAAAPTRPVTVAAASAPPPEPLPTVAPAPQSAQRPALPTRVEPVAPPAARDAAPVKAPPRTLAAAPAPAPMAAPQAVAATAPSPAPVPAETAPTPVAAQATAAASPPPWSVDAPGATQYLRDLMALLERPKEAGRTQDVLRSMNVKGSLLAPGLRLSREFPQVKVSAVTLSETRRPGALELRGTVQVQAQNSTNSTAVQYRVTAHFVGLEGGTALTRLELVDAQ